MTRASHTAPVLPGQTLGILGSGQLGRMLALSARQMGYRVAVFAPDATTSPAGAISDLTFEAAYTDYEALARFAEQVDTVTLEFENIPVEALAYLDERVPVSPGPTVLYLTQHRLREKQYLSRSGFPVVPFAEITTRASLDEAVNQLGLPAVLKTAGFGYDGKGQHVLRERAQLDSAYDALNGQPAILEQFIDFSAEFSVVAARGRDGAFVHYGLIENRHKNHVLDVSVSPAGFSDAVAKAAISVTRDILEELEVVGTFCIEFFLTRDQQILINEMAPRPHNSGHLTLDGAVTSQFEQQLRAVCNVPLGEATWHRATAMANLLGDLWQYGEPDWPAVLAMPGVKLHLYGKAEARPGRKMGHLTALADTPEAAIQRVMQARERLAAAVNTPLG